jgi:hypothetical protein
MLGQLQLYVSELNRPGFTGGQNSQRIVFMEQKKISKPYSPEFRERAVRLVLETYTSLVITAPFRIP